MPRPPVQHHKHIIALSKETLEVLEELQDTYIKGKAIAAAGEASEGILSNPNLAFLIGGGIMAAVATAVGADGAGKLTDYLASIATIVSPDASQEEKGAAANNAAKQLKDIIDALTLGATRIIPGP